jgi:hypothetical protein
MQLDRNNKEKIYVFVAYAVIIGPFIYLILRSLKNKTEFPELYFYFTIGLIILYNYIIPRKLSNENTFTILLRYICNLFYLVCGTYIFWGKIR